MGWALRSCCGGGAGDHTKAEEGGSHRATRILPIGPPGAMGNSNARVSEISQTVETRGITGSRGEPSSAEHLVNECLRGRVST
jgi:hypothetical protein